MAKFLVTNLHSGADFGAYDGEDAAEAVAAMMRDAGYLDVKAEAGRLVFPDGPTAETCGDIGEAWEARPAGE